MGTLRFTDGMTIHTNGPLRVTHKSDGYYVVGEGTCCPVDSRAEGEDMIKELTGLKGLKGLQVTHPVKSKPG